MKYGVTATYSQYAYIEVEADSVEEAEDKAADAFYRGEGEPMGDNEDSPDLEVEEL